MVSQRGCLQKTFSSLLLQRWFGSFQKKCMIIKGHISIDNQGPYENKYYKMLHHHTVTVCCAFNSLAQFQAYVGRLLSIKDVNTHNVLKCHLTEVRCTNQSGCHNLHYSIVAWEMKFITLMENKTTNNLKWLIFTLFLEQIPIIHLQLQCLLYTMFLRNCQATVFNKTPSSLLLVSVECVVKSRG